MIKKIARKLYTCGDCVYFDKDNYICKHEKMDRRAITADLITPCGGGHFIPLDDYENLKDW